MMASRVVFLCAIIGLGTSLPKPERAEKRYGINHQTGPVLGTSLPKSERAEKRYGINHQTGPVLGTSLPKSERAEKRYGINHQTGPVLGTSLPKSERAEKRYGINHQTGPVLGTSVSKPETEAMELNINSTQAVFGTSLPKTEQVAAETNFSMAEKPYVSMLAKVGEETMENNHGQTRTTLNTKLPKTEGEITADSQDLTETTFDSFSPLSQKGTTTGPLSETTFGKSSSISETAKTTGRQDEITFAASSISEKETTTDSLGLKQTRSFKSSPISEVKTKPGRDGETTFGTPSSIKTTGKQIETAFSTFSSIPKTPTTGSLGLTQTTSGPSFSSSGTRRDGSGLTDKSRLVASLAPSGSRRGAVTTIEHGGGARTSDQGRLGTAVTSIDEPRGVNGQSGAAEGEPRAAEGEPKAAEGEPKAAEGEPRAAEDEGGTFEDGSWHSKDSDHTKIGFKIFQAVPSGKFIAKAKVRPRRKYIKKKQVLEDNTDNKSNDGYHENRESGTDESDDDDSIYTLAHFRYELYSHVEDQASSINESVQGLVTNIQEKITKLENQQTAYGQVRCSLQSMLRATVTPNSGEIRVLAKEDCPKVVRTGYLQFYTGKSWGFVCDDFFNEAAARVACRQLGLAPSDDEAQLVGWHNGNVHGHDLADRSWNERFPIVLDDVHCSGDELRLDSCSHSEIGRHDCSMDEIVFLAC